VVGVFASREPRLRWAFPTTKLVVGGVVAAALGSLLLGFWSLLGQVVDLAPVFVLPVRAWILTAVVAMLASGVALTAGGFLWWALMTPAQRVRFFARRSLYAHRFGNPLGLKEGERLPRIRAARNKQGVIWLEVLAVAVTVEQLAAVQSALSSGLRGRLSGYAVTEVDSDVAARGVRFRVEDVTIDRAITGSSGLRVWVVLACR